MFLPSLSSNSLEMLSLQCARLVAIFALSSKPLFRDVNPPIIFLLIDD